MAVDYFLKIDGIEGESLDEKHKGEIEIESFSWGLTQPGGSSVGGGGGGGGKAQFRDISFVALISKASPKLFLACASGTHSKSAVLTVRKGGEQQMEFDTMTLEDVLISSYQQGSSQAPTQFRRPGASRETFRSISSLSISRRSGCLQDAKGGRITPCAGQRRLGRQAQRRVAPSP